MSFAENKMTYSKYTNLPNDELIALALNATTIDPLVHELATRLIAAEDELDEFPEPRSLEDVLAAVHTFDQEDRRKIKVELEQD